MRSKYSSVDRELLIQYELLAWVYFYRLSGSQCPRCGVGRLLSAVDVRAYAR